MDNHGTRVSIPLDRLRTDGAFQPRLDGLREQHVRLLLASDPATWPPLLVTPDTDGTFLVIDGAHRLETARRLGLVALPCRIDPMAGYPDAVAANLNHGLPLSLDDRKAFARWLAGTDPGLSYRELGRRSGLNHETVRRALEADESDGGENRQHRPDPIARLVSQVERIYYDGHGRTWVGFGKAGNPSPFRQALEAYAEEDRPVVARALAAFGYACTTAAAPYLDDQRGR